MPPDTIQVVGTLGYHWSPSGDLVLGNRPENVLGHLGCLQEHDPLTTSELPTLYGTTLKY
jgi:hypothetical protein